MTFQNNLNKYPIRISSCGGAIGIHNVKYIFLSNNILFINNKSWQGGALCIINTNMEK